MDNPSCSLFLNEEGTRLCAEKIMPQVRLTDIFKNKRDVQTCPTRKIQRPNFDATVTALIDKEYHCSVGDYIVVLLNTTPPNGFFTNIPYFLLIYEDACKTKITQIDRIKCPEPVGLLLRQKFEQADFPIDLYDVCKAYIGNAIVHHVFFRHLIDELSDWIGDLPCEMPVSEQPAPQHAPKPYKVSKAKRQRSEKVEFAIDISTLAFQPPDGRKLILAYGKEAIPLSVRNLKTIFNNIQDQFFCNALGFSKEVLIADNLQDVCNYMTNVVEIAGSYFLFIMIPSEQHRAFSIMHQRNLAREKLAKCEGAIEMMQFRHTVNELQFDKAINPVYNQLLLDFFVDYQALRKLETTIAQENLVEPEVRLLFTNTLPACKAPEIDSSIYTIPFSSS